LGTERIPDPTTEGDFCRRFSVADVLTLMDAINRTRLRVWGQQHVEFFDNAIIEADCQRAVKNHDGLESAKRDLQSVFKKPGGDIAEPGVWVTLRGEAGKQGLSQAEMFCRRRRIAALRTGAVCREVFSGRRD
jgi:hypothetical protein